MEPTISIHNPKCGDCGEALKDHENWRLKMSKKIVNYDFTIDSLVSVEAPEGTNPEELVGRAIKKLIERAREGDISLAFDTCFDSETGDYSEEWERGKGSMSPCVF